MSNFLLSSFAMRAHHDDRVNEKLGQFMPPLLVGREGLYLDFSPLLLVPSLIMDKTSYDVVTSRGTGLPDTVQDQLRALHGEGFILHHDYSQLDEYDLRRIKAATSAALQNYEAWRPMLLNVVGGWLQAGQQYTSLWGKLEREGTIPYVLNEYLSRNGKYNDLAAAVSLWETVQKAIQTHADSGNEIVKDLLEILLDHVYTQMIISFNNRATNYEWQNFQQIFGEANRIWQAAESVSGARPPREILGVVPYEFDQVETRKIIKLLKDKRVEEVRAFWNEMVDSGLPMDNKMRNLLWKATLDAQLNLQRERKISLYMKPLTFLIGFVPGGGHINEGLRAGLHVAVEAVAVAVERGSTHGNVDQKKAADAMYVMHRNLSGGDT